MWYPRFAWLVLFLLALAALPAPVAAQGPDTPVSADQVAGPPASPTQVPQVPAGAEPALPERAAPARTLRAYWHVFIAFALVWALLFGYALSVGWRLGGLEREIAALQRGSPPV
ncbi:MAG TPA: CcmD family protein [Longimicrobiaceae bacterium]|nr:CcmD family protein [Longimicrobiaceae bacterium]